MPSLDKDERFTPPKYVSLIKTVLGTIDLDPASSDIGNRIVKARNIFTKLDNGLNQRWFGKVYCNPPYSRGNLEKWCAKARFEFDQGNFDEGIMLVPNSTDTDWFGYINHLPFCATEHRISFLIWNNNTEKFYYISNPENGSFFMLMSNKIETYRLFFHTFSKIGSIYRKVIMLD